MTYRIAADETTTSSLIIGVDGGGTKTEAALARVDQHGSLHILSRCTAGPGNLQSSPLSKVAEHVLQAIRSLLAEQPDGQSVVAAIAFCMAGAGNDPLRQQFEAWAVQQQLAGQIVVTHDARALIEAGTADGHGVALIAGTGSLAYARTPTGQQTRCGGWGGLFGDEGSAYWLAIEALRAASHAVDGRGPETRLVSAIAQWLGCADPQQWPTQVRMLQPKAIAAAAPRISQLADEADAVAVDLILRCADQLSRMIVNLAHRCFAGAPVEVALAGGFILQNDLLRQAVLDRVIRAGIVVGACRDVPHPVEGAVRLAARPFLPDGCGLQPQ